MTVPFYLRTVGVERYGVLALCLTLLMFVSFASLGVGPALNRGLATVAGSPRRERAELFWTAATLTLAIAVVLFPLSWLIGHFALPLIDPKGALPDAELISAAPWLAALITTSLFGGTFIGALQGRRQFGLLTVIGLIGSSLNALLPLIAAVALSPRLDILIAALAVGGILQNVAQFVGCLRLVPALPIQLPEPSLVRPLLGYGGWMTVTAAVAPVLLFVDRFVIGAIAGAAAVSAYVIAFSLVSRVTVLAGSFHAAALPRFAAATCEEEQRLTDLSVSGLLIVLTPITIVGAAVISPFFHFWLGLEISNQAAQTGLVLLIGVFAHSIGHVPSTVLMARGQPEIVSRYLLLSVAPYLMILTLLVAYEGALGAAFAWSIRAHADYVLFRKCNFQLRRLLQVAFCSLLVSAAALTGLSLSFANLWYWMAFFLNICIFLIVILPLNKEALFAILSNVRRVDGKLAQ